MGTSETTASDKRWSADGEAVAEYVHWLFSDEDELLRGVRERQAKAGMRPIQVAPMDGLHLEVLARVAGARKAVEIGTLGGYSGVRLLRGMGEGGHLHTFELVATHAAVAAETFARAGMTNRVTIHQGPALERLHDIDALGPFDLVFIDADKDNYPGYLAWAGEHLRVGGTVICDNAFLHGSVAFPATGPDAARIAGVQRCNEELARGGRFRATMLPTGEGLALGVKIR